MSNTVTCKLEALAEKLSHRPRVKEFIETYLTSFVSHHEQQVLSVRLLEKLGDKTGVPALTFVASALAVFLFYIKRKVKHSGHVITTLFGVIMPALNSLSTIDHPSKDENKKYLTYWPAFGLLSLLESFRVRVPMYYALKFMILYWLLEKGGSATVFNRIIHPLVAKYRSIISNEQVTMPGALGNNLKRMDIEPFRVPIEEKVAELAPCAEED